MNRYKAFYAVYNASVKRGNPLTKEEIVMDFTGGKTASLGDLSQWELDELTRLLRLQFAPKVTPTNRYANDPRDKQRKGIIAIFRSMGRTVADAIGWAEKQGVKGEKKRFNDYSAAELYWLTRLAEKVKMTQEGSIRNKLK